MEGAIDTNTPLLLSASYSLTLVNSSSTVWLAKAQGMIGKVSCEVLDFFIWKIKHSFLIIFFLFWKKKKNKDRSSSMDWRSCACFDAVFCTITCSCASFCALWSTLGGFPRSYSSRTRSCGSGRCFASTCCLVELIFECFLKKVLILLNSGSNKGQKASIISHLNIEKKNNFWIIFFKKIN